MEIKTVIVAATTIMLSSSVFAAELVRLYHPKHRYSNSIIYKTIGAAKKDLKLDGCILRDGTWVKLIKFGPNYSKVATRSSGANKCEGYVNSIFVKRRK